MLSLERQNRLREQYRETHPDWQPATELYAGLVRKYLAPGSKVLDLGCGRGGLVEQLGHPLHLVAGVDPDLLSLQEHRLPLPRVQAWSQALPFAGSSFDLAFASWLLEHLAEPSRDLKELARVLRPGGVFVFVTPNRRHPLALLNRLLGRGKRMQGWLVERAYGRAGTDAFPTTYRANDDASLNRLARATGMELVRLEHIGDPTYLAFTQVTYRLAEGLETFLPPSRRLHLVGVMRKATSAPSTTSTGSAVR